LRRGSQPWIPSTGISPFIIQRCWQKPNALKRFPRSALRLPQTNYLERDEIEDLFHTLPKQGALALRDQSLFMVLYNAGARVQEVADLCRADVDLDGPPRIRLHGKGDKWRSCPLWPETAELLKGLIGGSHGDQTGPLFVSRRQKPLTRFGIYKIVKRHTSSLRSHLPDKKCHGVSPHVIRHSSAVGLLEQGVEVNVIRAWLGHVSLDTTNRYAEITLRTKQAVVATCIPPAGASEALRQNSGCRKDEELMKWLSSL